MVINNALFLPSVPLCLNDLSVNEDDTPAPAKGCMQSEAGCHIKLMPHFVSFLVVFALSYIVLDSLVYVFSQTVSDLIFW